MILSVLFKPMLKADKLEEKVLSVQLGDERLRNQILSDYQPFICKSASKVCKRYITQSDEEFSVGLIAFNEAIQSFSSYRGSSFLSFADLLVRRRIIDYIRKEAKNHHLSMELYLQGDDEESTSRAEEVNEAFKHYSLEEENLYRREEILHYQERLKEFKISLEKLTDVSPKHLDTRKQCMDIAKIITTHTDIKEQLLSKKRLPIKELESLVSVSRKTLERNRIYIIALTLIYIEDYVYLKNYLQ